MPRQHVGGGSCIVAWQELPIRYVYLGNETNCQTEAQIPDRRSPKNRVIWLTMVKWGLLLSWRQAGKVGRFGKARQQTRRRNNHKGNNNTAKEIINSCVSDLGFLGGFHSRFRFQGGFSFGIVFPFLGSRVSPWLFIHGS